MMKLRNCFSHVRNDFNMETTQEWNDKHLELLLTQIQRGRSDVCGQVPNRGRGYLHQEPIVSAIGSGHR